LPATILDDFGEERNHSGLSRCGIFRGAAQAPMQNAGVMQVTALKGISGGPWGWVRGLSGAAAVPYNSFSGYADFSCKD